MPIHNTRESISGTLTARDFSTDFSRDHFVYAPSQWEMMLHLQHHLTLAGCIHKMIPASAHWCPSLKTNFTADDIMKCVFLDENMFCFFNFTDHWKLFPMGQLTSELVWVMAWQRTHEKPLLKLISCWCVRVNHRILYVLKSSFNSNCYHFAKSIFKCNFMEGNICISNRISLNFVPKRRYNGCNCISMLGLKLIHVCK